MIGASVLPLVLLLGNVQVDPTPAGFQGAVQLDDPGHSATQGASHFGSVGQSSSADSPGTSITKQACRTGGSETCAELATCTDGSAQMVTIHTSANGTVDSQTFYCASNPPSNAATTAQAGPTPGQVYSAFKTVVPPESALEFQPAGNQTLVHFKSNYFTDAAPFDTAIDLPVGPATFHVDFKIRPTEFDWTFGDGTTRTTSTPGAPYPHLEVTHEYQKAGTVRAHVDTVWGADFRVNGGAWAPVDGTVTKHGADVTVTVRQATPVLTD